MLGGLVGMPIGVGVLPHLDADAFKLGLGACCSCRLPGDAVVGERLPRTAHAVRPRRRCAGRRRRRVMGGLGGFTGVIPTLWCTLRGFDKAAQRAVVQNFNLATLAATMAAYLATGAVTRPMWPLLPVVLPRCWCRR